MEAAKKRGKDSPRVAFGAPSKGAVSEQGVTFHSGDMSNTEPRRCPGSLPQASNGLLLFGGPERTRTSDLRFRKPLLYPAELRDRKGFS